MRVVVKFFGVPCCERDMDAFLRDVDEIYKKDQEFLILYDATQVGFVGASMVQKQIAFMRGHDEETRRLIKKCAVVVNTTFASAIVNGIFAVKPPACPLKVFADVDAAKQYLKSA